MSKGKILGHISVQCPFEIATSAATAQNALDDRRSQALARILEKSSRIPNPKPHSSENDLKEPIWNEYFFSLHLSSFYQALSQEKKNAVLLRCSKGLLYESQMIELAGTTFAAKMALLSETVAERELYSLFAADEARHLRMISSIRGAPNSDPARENPFLQYLGNLILSEKKAPLVLLIQVVLEGWGISHYTRLAELSMNSSVSQVFQEILKDEAKHHGSGLLLFSEEDISESDRERLVEQLSHFLTMVRTGPFSVVQTLASETGGMSAEQVRLFLKETEFQKKLENDLELLHHLLLKSGAGRIVSGLHRSKLFELPSLEECSAQISAGLEICA